jgi:hypothetical protein
MHHPEPQAALGNKPVVVQLGTHRHPRWTLHLMHRRD